MSDFGSFHRVRKVLEDDISFGVKKKKTELKKQNKEKSLLRT